MSLGAGAKLLLRLARLALGVFPFFVFPFFGFFFLACHSRITRMIKYHPIRCLYVIFTQRSDLVVLPMRPLMETPQELDDLAGGKEVDLYAHIVRWVACSQLHGHVVGGSKIARWMRDKSQSSSSQATQNSGQLSRAGKIHRLSPVLKG